MAVMLFHVEGDGENLVLYWASHISHSLIISAWFSFSPDVNLFLTQVNACSRIDMIHGVLGWSTGCSWSSSIDSPEILEC